MVSEDMPRKKVMCLEMSGTKKGTVDTMKESKSYICCNRLTVMNAARLVRMVAHSDCNVLIGVDGIFCSAGNVLCVLSLRIEYGDPVSIIAEGADAHEVIENIGDLLCEDGETGVCLPACG